MNKLWIAVVGAVVAVGVAVGGYFLVGPGQANGGYEDGTSYSQYDGGY